MESRGGVSGFPQPSRAGAGRQDAAELRVLITGAGGQLGRELIRLRPPCVKTLARTRAELDVTSWRAVEACCAEFRPDLIVNAAGINALQAAECDPDTAFALNADAAANLARIASDGPRLIHISSNQVFADESGHRHQPDETPRPLSVFGASKSEGESLVLGIAHQRALVLRTAWLYSAYGDNCFTRIFRALSRGGELFMPKYRHLTPTWAAGLANAIWMTAFRPTLYGIHHWTDRGTASWYEFAAAIRDEAAALGLIAGRPRVRAADDADEAAGDGSVLDNSPTWEALGTRSEHWRRALRTMLMEMAEVTYAYA